MSPEASNNFRSGLLGEFTQVPAEGGTKRRPVVVVGGGISGLLIAYGLMRKGRDVKLFEATSRVGGLIQTAVTPYGLAETAAHSFLLTANVEKLLAELGLTPLKTRPESRARYIYKNGKMHKLPLSLIDICTALWRLFTARINEGDTVAQFADRHLGCGLRKFLLSPALTGIYAGDVNQMSAAAVFPFIQGNGGARLITALRRAKASAKATGGKTKGMATLPGGVQDLVDALARKLGSRILLNTPVDNLDLLRQDHDVVLACGPRSAAKLLSAPKEAQLDSTPKEAQLDSVPKEAEVRTRTSAGLESAPRELIKSLESVEILPLVTTTVFYNRADLKKFKPGVGVLMVQGQGVRALGILYNSSTFLGRASPPIESFTVMYGGALDKAALNLNDSELERAIEQDFSTVLGAQNKPLCIKITRWANALPHHKADLCDLWQVAKEQLPPGVLLFGNYTGQISLRGLIETVARALSSA